MSRWWDRSWGGMKDLGELGQHEDRHEGWRGEQGPRTAGCGLRLSPRDARGPQVPESHSQQEASTPGTPCGEGQAPPTGRCVL